MKDENDDDLPPVRRFAKRTSSMLAGFEEAEGLPDDFLSLLSPRSKVLLDDARGLLMGIEQGYITTSQPRIRDTFLEVVQELSAVEDSEPHRTFAAFLSRIVTQAAMFGITADQQSLEPFPHQKRARLQGPA